MRPSPEQLLAQQVLSTKQIREVDHIAVREFGMHSLVLMENAALGCVEWICRRFASPLNTVVLCGPGNNGGDGLVITRHLCNRGWNCQAFLLGPESRFSSDTRHHFEILTAGGGTSVKLVNSQPQSDSQYTASLRAKLSSAQLIIDAMLGTGAKGNPRPPISDWIRWSNATEAFRIAIDLPSGVNADSGECGVPTFCAHATLTFVALKPSMVTPEASQIYGLVQVLPIGIPERQITQMLSLSQDGRYELL